MKTTNIGKFLKKLRIDNNELLKDMADKLGISPSYLSYIETGDRKMSTDIKNNIIKIYHLTKSSLKEFDDAYITSQDKLSFNIKQTSSDSTKNLIFALARNIESLSEQDKQSIQAILNKEDK